jgi:hypothetical protein
MSFALRSVQADLLSKLDIRTKDAVILRADAMPVAATPTAIGAGIAIGSAMVGAALAGAQVGDAAD